MADRVTFTRTRLAITSQIERACEKLGMTYATTTAPDGRLAVLVDDVPMTTGDAANYLLDGGFAAAFGRNTVVVHPDRLTAQAVALAAKHAGDHATAKAILDADMPQPSWKER
jgi:hypothetical protein